ncbi:MAG: DUF1572 family protein [Gemmatimonadaceae bacterium]
MPNESLGAAVLASTIAEFQKLKAATEKAAAQVDDASFVRVLDAESNSIAIIMKHMAGNLRSRFTDFLTADGEKPDRDRDGEFELRGGDTRASIMAQWESGWSTLFASLAQLTLDDLPRSVTIRSEPVTVLDALQRAVIHQATHVGQIVLLAKHYAGGSWTTLSVARGKSVEHNAEHAAKFAK